MPFIIRVIAIRNGGEKLLKQTQGSIHIAQAYRTIHTAYGSKPHIGIVSQIVRQQTLHQSHPYLPVRNIQRVKLGIFIIVLYRDIAALIEQRRNSCHPLGRGIKTGSHSLHAVSHFRGKNMELAQHLYQIGGRAAAKPIRV